MGQVDKLVADYGAELKKKLLEPVFFIEQVIFEPLSWKLPEYAKEWLYLVQQYKRTNFTAFRSSGKSEVLLVCYGIWRAFKQKSFMGIIISSSLNQSVEILKRIKERVLENEVLRSAIPQSRSSVWSKTELEFKNGSRILCKPYNANIRGYHVDWVGLDEIGEYRDHEILRYSVSPIVIAKNGDINCIGTPTSQIDLIHKLRENKSYISKIYPAWTDNVNLFKQRYPDREVVKKGGKYRILDKDGVIMDEYDGLTWSREFMCVPLGDEDKLYPFDMIEQSFDYNLRVSREINTNSTYFIGVDFALSAESGADYTVIIILERTKEGKVILCDMERWKGLSYNAQKIRIGEILNVFKPIRAVLDESSFGRSFIDDLRRMVSGISIEGFKFSAGPYTNEKQILITSLRSSFEANWEIYSTNEKIPREDKEKKFVIPRDKTDTRTMKLTTDILDELLSFGVKYDMEKHTVKFEGIGSHDDIVVALALANYAAAGTGSLKAIINRGSTGYQRLIVGKTH